MAADTKSGKDQAETVTAVLVHRDTDLYNLTVRTGHGTEVIRTTSSHLFYDPYLDQWIPANHLKKGEKLKTPDGQSAVVVGGSVPADHDGWMWDLTVPGNNDHDFYVVAPQSVAGADAYDARAEGQATAVLVHNQNTPGCSVGGPPQIPQGLTTEQFAGAGQIVRSGAGHLGDDIVVQGSRAAGTARSDSDLDLAIRVSPERFDELVSERFGTPNPGSAKERTMLWAMQTGKIQAGEAGVSAVRRSLEAYLGMDVDLSVIRVGGPFDNPPFIEVPL